MLPTLGGEISQSPSEIATQPSLHPFSSTQNPTVLSTSIELSSAPTTSPSTTVVPTESNEISQSPSDIVFHQPSSNPFTHDQTVSSTTTPTLSPTVLTTTDSPTQGLLTMLDTHEPTRSPEKYTVLVIQLQQVPCL